MQEEFDVIIAGSGVSGLHTALRLDRRLKVLVLSKDNPELCNTALAQGGVAAVLDRQSDDFSLHFNDTMIAGGGTNNPDSVRVLVQDGPKNVLELSDFDVDFDRSPDGSLDLALEGGHSRRRIAHYRDTSGFEIEMKLLDAARRQENITIIGCAALLDVENSGNSFCASVLCDGQALCFYSHAVVMATGGIGRLFRYTTNSAIATGDGIYLASKLGAKIRNLKLVQFHPTAFAGVETQQRFLISESLRGEGALLLNCRGERFMDRYDSRLELAPRDVVSNAIRLESAQTGSEDFYLDVTGQEPEFLKSRFPGIYNQCMEYGVDITKDRIPVFPCQHYLMGGIDVDVCARTCVPGLYAVGECSHTGVHGNNRLASNSLLEALVFSRRAAEDIMGHAGGSAGRGHKFTPREGEQVSPGKADEIQKIMQNCFFIIADKEAAQNSLPRVKELRAELDDTSLRQDQSLLEAQSLAFLAETILTEVIEG